MKGGHLHETTKTWITLVQVRSTAVLQCVVTVTMQPLQAVCSGMKLGYTAEEGAGRGEEEPGLQDTEAEQETSRWRRTSCITPPPSLLGTGAVSAVSPVSAFSASRFSVSACTVLLVV